VKRSRLKRRNPVRAQEARAEDFGELAEFVRGLPCAVAGCKRTPSEPAHVVSRGAGGHAWVMLDGKPVGNIAPLCRAHHTGGPGVTRPQHTIGLRAFDAENIFHLRLPGHAVRVYGNLAAVAAAVGEWVLTCPEIGAPA
jgi:hypothetical protein